MQVDLVVGDPNWTTGFKLKLTGGSSKTITRSGAIYSLQIWPYGQRSWTLPYDPMQQAQFQAIVEFINLRGVDARGWVFWDPTSYWTPEVTIGVGDGSTKNFQLYIPYIDAGNSYARPIYHPFPTGTTVPYQLTGVGTPSAGDTYNSVWVNGVLQTEGTDYTTLTLGSNLVEFATAPGAGDTVSWAGWYGTSVYYDGPTDMDLEGILSTGMFSIREIWYA